MTREEKLAQLAAQDRALRLAELDRLHAEELARQRGPVVKPFEATRFKTVEQVQREIQAAAEEKAQAAFEAAAEPPVTKEAADAFRERERKLELERIARQREQVVTVGREEQPSAKPGAYTLPMFRPTRIENVPMIPEPEVPEALRAPVQITPKVLVPYKEIPTQKLYRDPDTGELRPPTASEEFFESFAQQPVMTEEQARARGEQIQRAEEAVALYQGMGQPVPEEVKAQLGPKISGILTQPRGMGQGVTETALGATLRAVPSYLSALAAEGYFRGLGYEVDEKGLPVDPTDFGYEIAKIREKLGIPETATAMDVVTGTAKKLGVELDPSAAAMSPLSAVPLPIPGFATRREQRIPTVVDPEARRAAVAAGEVPSEGFLSDEARRIARNVSVGRSLGDEFLSVPELREAYAARYGDEKAAFWAGTVGDILIPAGPGTASKLAFKGAKAAAESGAAAKLAGGLIAAAEAVPGTSIPKKALDFTANIAAITTKGAPSEGRIVREVARKIIDTSPELSPDAKVAIKAAINPTDNTIKEVANSVREGAKAAQTGAPLEEQANLLRSANRFEKMLTQRVPDDLVLVSETVAVPRKLAPKIKPIQAGVLSDFSKADNAGKVAILDKYVGTKVIGRLLEENEFSKLTPKYQQFVLERLRSAVAVDEAPRLMGGAVKQMDEVTNFNTYMGPRALKPLLDNYVARAVSTLYDTTPTTTVTVDRARKAIQGASTRAVPRVRAAILAQIKDGASLDKALDNLLADGLPSPAGVAGRAVQLVDERPQAAAAWRALLGELYGPDRVDYIANRLQEMERVGSLPKGLTSAMPTVEGLKEADKTLLLLGAVPVGRPDFQKAMLKYIFEDVVRGNIAQEGTEFEALLRGSLPLKLPKESVLQEWRGLVADIERGSLKYAEQALKEATINPDNAVTRSVPFLRNAPIKRVYDTLASVEEAKIAEGGKEFVDLVLSLEPSKRLGLGQLAAEAGGWAGRATRNALHGAKYGYYLPNLPYLAYKSMALPVVSLATIGASNTLKALAKMPKRTFTSFGEALSDAFGHMPANRVFGAAVETPSGIKYTPAQVEDLINRYGIGLTEIDVTRRTSLADDLLRDARQAARGKAMSTIGVASPKPWAKSFWMRYAEAIENSYRRSVFEGALANGASPLEASELARRSLFDYNEVPDFVRETIGSYLASAATDYAIMNELVIQSVANPNMFTKLAKSKLAQQKANDPYGYYGDKGLKSIGIFPVANTTGETFIYGPQVPVFEPVEDALSLINGANKSVSTALKTYDLVKQLDLEATLGEVSTLGLEGATAAVNRYYPAVLKAFEASQGDLERQGIKPSRDLTDQQLFWAALLAADMAERRGNPGVRDAVFRILEPQIVPPPKQFAYDKPGYENTWDVQPPGGVPHVYAGVGDEGQPLFKVYKPSSRGVAQLKILKAIAPKVLERAIGPAVSVALAQADAGSKVTVAPLFPSGYGGAAGQLFGEVAPTPQQRRLAMEQGVKAVREPE